MNIDRIEGWVNKLSAQLRFRSDYQLFATGTFKLLLVEGRTDANFIKELVKEDVKYEVANKAFPPNAKDEKNWKEAIAYVVFGLTKIPALINCPSGSENWKVYGMTDLDFDDSDEYANNPRLFVTDTHDLETLMLSTDDTLLQRLEDCQIPDSDIKMTYLMAYELGKVRQFLSDSGFSSFCLSCNNSIVPFGTLFNEEGRISASALINYVQKNDFDALNRKKIVGKTDKFFNHKQVKKAFDKDGLWKIGINEFNHNKLADFWTVVNGHDIVHLLKYLNADVALLYSSSGAKLDREFENALIEKYDYSKLPSTIMFQRMIKEDIVTVGSID